MQLNQGYVGQIKTINYEYNIHNLYKDIPYPARH